jgi:hypothetical protein
MLYYFSVNKLKSIFKKIILFSTFVVLVGASMLFTLGYSFEVKSPFQKLPTARGSADGLQLTMTLEKTEYNLGEPINITLIITNISNQTKNFEMGPDVNDFDFHVYNDTNNNIYWYSSRWVGSAIPMYIVYETLNAGESLNCTLVWQQTFSHMLDSVVLHVSPGTYYVVGRIGPPYFYGKNSTMETTPIQIIIG